MKAGAARVQCPGATVVPTRFSMPFPLRVLRFLLFKFIGQNVRNVFPQNTQNTQKDEKMCQTPLSASFCVVCPRASVCPIICSLLQKPVLIIGVNPCHPWSNL